MKKCYLLLFVLFINFFMFSDSIEVWHRWNIEESVALIKNISKFQVMTGHTVILKNMDYNILKGKFISESKTGNAPDLIITSTSAIIPFVAADLLMPINNMVDSNKQNQFIPSTFNDGFYRDNLYGLPVSFKLLALIYNKELIDNPPKTTDELLKVGREFTNIDKGLYGLAYPIEDYYYQIPWITGFGGELVEDGNVFFNSKPHIKALNFSKSLHFGKDAIMPEGVNYDLMLSLFIEGQIPMIINGTWIIGDLLKAKMNIGVTSIPKVSYTGMQPKPYVSSEIIMMSKQTKNKKLAYSLMDFLTSEEAQLENSKAGHLPTMKSVYNLQKFKDGPTYDILNGFQAQAQFAYPQPKDEIIGSVIWKIGESILEESLYDNSPIDNKMDKFQDRAEVMISNLE